MKNVIPSCIILHRLMVEDKARVRYDFADDKYYYVTARNSVNSMWVGLSPLPRNGTEVPEIGILADLCEAKAFLTNRESTMKIKVHF